MAVALNNANTMAFSATSPVSTTAMTVNGGGLNVVAFAMIAYDNSAGMSVSSVTYDGLSMTSAGVAAHNTTNHCYAEIWYLANPPIGGSRALVITVAGTIQDIYYNLVSFKNVNQTTPVRAGTYQAKAAVGTTDSMVITSNVNDLTISCTNTGGAAFGATPTNQTNDSTNTGGGFAGGSDHATTAATSVTHTWTYAASTNNAVAGLSINGTFPLITTNPWNQTTEVGDTATFTVAATTSGGVLHYQWHNNGSNVGTDSNTYTTAAATGANNLSAIYCTVTDDNGSSDSLHVYWLVIGSTVIW